MTIYIQYHALADLLHLPVHGQNIRLNQEQRKQIQQYRNQVLYSQSSLSDALLIVSDTFGKPLAVNDNTLTFNHSHSQQYYALAYSHHVQRLGVDIEDFSRKIRLQALAEHAFHPQELEHWHDLSQDRHFWFGVWTTKEAILKAHGLGIRLDLKTLNTNFCIQQSEGYVSDERLGAFYYQNLCLPQSMLTVAYADSGSRHALVLEKK